MPHSPYDDAMRRAIAEASKGRFTACPNPTVGAVLIKDGEIRASGWHHQAGQPHAEIMCLADAEAKGISPKGATMCVTLEPCNHTGRTGPCSEALIKAGVAKVVVGMRDPNPVACGGIERLKGAGIEVEEGVLEQDCRDLTADFTTWTLAKRPFVIVKMASTLDGRIATRTGHSRWVTSEAARAAVHRLRQGIGLAGGAVLVGGATFRQDDPLLTSRIEGSDGTDLRQPLACVVTSRLPGPRDGYKLLTERPTQTAFFVDTRSMLSPEAMNLCDMGLKVVPIDRGDKGAYDFGFMLDWLFKRGVRYVLCEGGGRLALSLMEAGCCDMLLLHLSPKILGDSEAKPVFAGRSPLAMDEALGFRLAKTEALGEDLALTLFPRRER